MVLGFVRIAPGLDSRAAQQGSKVRGTSAHAEVAPDLGSCLYWRREHAENLHAASRASASPIEVAAISTKAQHNEWQVLGARSEMAIFRQNETPPIRYFG